MSASEEGKSPGDEPRFSRPKILAVDLPSPALEAIRGGGYNVRAGSFGRPIRVGRSRHPHAVPLIATLPNVTEQEVVIIDLTSPSPTNFAIDARVIAKATHWQITRDVLVEPRPYAMHAFRSDFDRILTHGGVFVVFAGPEVQTEYIYAPDGNPGYGTEVSYSNWSFLDALADLQISYDDGEEIQTVAGLDPPLSRALADGAHFLCTIAPGFDAEKRWVSLAENKYGRSVAGILAPEKASGTGWVMVLPHVADKGALVCDLLDGFLPSLAAKLFPEDERQAWAEDDRYAPPGVAELRAESSAARAAAEATESEFERRIEALRAEGAHLRLLLTATGAELVDAVRNTLGELGFDDVRDVDQAGGVKNGRLGEDLQIHTDSPIVVSEVKGINGLPSDAEALEVQKYLLPRAKEWKRTDVHGLTIINHQRGLPPADRAAEVFQGDQVSNAEAQDIGLLTTFDLFRLVRGFHRNGWRHEDVAPLFTQDTGRVETLPRNYMLFGRVHNFLSDKGVVIVELDQDRAVSVGERLGFVGPVEFVEETITSIQFDGAQLDLSPTSGRIGLKTELPKEEVRKGTPVYLVGTASSTSSNVS